MFQSVTISYLEMNSPGDFAPSKAVPPAELEIRRAAIPSPELSRYLYTAVGGDWYWIDKLRWDYEQWMAYLDRPEIETWIAYLAGTPVGYAELEQRYEDGVEIAYFGLLPQFLGRGIGGTLLSEAVKRCWQLTDKKITVNTCSLDGPHALKSYISRGFKIARESIVEKELPNEPVGPWPGCR